MSDIDDNRTIHVKRVMNEIKRTYGYDGMILFAFHHTDDSPKTITYYHVGNVPMMDETMFAFARVLATQSYELGRTDAENEFNKKTTSNLDDTSKP